MPTFDPNAAAASNSGIFGLPHSAEAARVWLLPVPFDATTSYRKGAAQAPAAILQASRQVDLFDLRFGRPYEQGIHLLPEDPRVAAWNAEASRLAQPIIELGGALAGSAQLVRDLARVNAIGVELNRWVEAEVGRALDAGKLLGLVGGDHAVPFGAYAAAAKRHPGLGLLHFDAHADLRKAYEGFEWSHASILRNAHEHLMTKDASQGVGQVLQVGIRDLCEEEFDCVQRSGGRLHALYDWQWSASRAEGANLRALVRRELSVLPRQVWITFDVDGLEQHLCPGTGTPVPGGLNWGEAMLWLEELVASGRQIVGFDLVEVAPSATAEGSDSWDAVVGARLLYRLVAVLLAARTER